MNFVQYLNPIQGSLVAESQDFWSINWQQFTELLTFVDFAANEKLTIGFVRIDFESDLDILMEGLKTHRRCQDIQFEVFNLDDKNLWSVREELMKGLKVIERDREKKLVLIVRGLASSIGLSGEYPLVLQTLNLNRDAFEITVPHPIIFCLPDYAIDRLSRYAPDFWVWKSGVFDFEATQKTQDTALASSLLSDGFLERAERQEKPERIEFLHSRLVKYSRLNSNRTKGDLNRIIYLLNELGVAYRSQGKFNDAGEYLSEALELANTQEEPRNTDLALKAGVLRNLGTIDVANKDFDSALAYYQQALEIEEEIGNFLGKADTLERMTNLYASKLRFKGTLPASEYAEAERLLVDVWTLKKRLLGDSHPDLAISRNNLARLYYSQGRYEEAEPLYLEALALRKELLGSSGPDFTTITNNLARLYYSQGRYEEAEPLYLEALAERKELLGEKDPDLSAIINNLAELYLSQGRYSQAEPLYLEALTLRKELLGEKHPDVATITNNLARLYESQERYTEAEPLLKQALTLRKELLYSSHPDIATSINNLALLYKRQGRYGEAEPLYLEALALRKEFLGPSHPYVATSMNNLAALYYSQGRYGEAEPLFKQALALRKKLLGEKHPDVATSTNNLAELYRSQGRYGEAEPLYLEALALTKKLLGSSHPQVATSTNNLAGLYYSQGRYSEAEPLYLEALAMYKELLGEKHPDLATSTNNLAGLYYSQGRYEEAEALYRDSLKLTKELLGPSHPNLVQSTNNLALLLALTDRPTEALALMKEATEVEDRLIRRTFATSSDRDRLAYLEKIRPNFEILLSLVRNYLWDSPAAVATALDVVLKRKSLTASALAAFNHALNSDRYPHLKEDFQRWQQLNQEIVELTFSPPEANWPTTREQFRQQKQDRQQRLNQLQAESDELERRLASQISEIQVPEQDSHIRAIALELPAGSALLEFVRYRNYDFANNSWQPSRYLAFVLPAGQPEGVRAVDLGDAEEIDRSIARFLQATREPTSSSELELGQGIFSEELQEAIEGYRHLLIAPDGHLNFVPFSALPADNSGEERLIDKYTISYLSVGRDLLRWNLPANRPASAPLILADPDFNWGMDEVVRKTADIATLGLGKEGESFFQRAIATDYLAETVGKILGVKPCLQRDATELQLTNGNCPRVLLVATCGEFVPQNNKYLELVIDLFKHPPEEEGKILENNRSLINWELLEIMEAFAVANKDNEEAATRFQNIAKQVEESLASTPTTASPSDRPPAKPKNQMWRSGIALAGANTWLSGRPLPPEAGKKGILSAGDIVSLDLWGCELAVLSADETGLDYAWLGEGVFGIRRAFTVAGVKTLIMSLGAAPARGTALLMERFFRNLSQGLGRGEALRGAQQYLRSLTVEELEKTELGMELLEELRSNSLLSSDRSEHRPLAHPYFWGLWICQGDTRSLEL